MQIDSLCKWIVYISYPLQLRLDTILKLIVIAYEEL